MLFLNRSTATAVPKRSRLPIASRIVASLGAALMLASCGGGGDQKETFQANRVVVFGDEASVINDGSDSRFPRGSKFTVNVASTVPGAPLLCGQNPIWVDFVAGLYGLVFDECNPNNVTPRAVMKAKYGSKVADVKAQIDTYLATTSLGKTDLITLMAGTNDILAQYDAAHASPPASEASMIAAVEQAGTLLGDQVLRLTNLKAKVLIATLPDLSLTPLGRTATAADAGLLSRLTRRFNDKLRLRIADDPNGGGRSGALLSADDAVTLFSINVGNQYGFTNVTTASCTTTTPGVTVPAPMATEKLPTECFVPSSGVYLWAGLTQLSAAGHAQLGVIAQSALRRNPL